MPNWKPLRKGIGEKELALDSETKLKMSLLKIEAGFNDIGHRHDSWEWVYILEGSLEDEKGLHKKGDFLINTTEGIHRPSSQDGCVVLIVWSGKVHVQK
ncbi:MAG: hypothetical protein COV47_05810 [Candidatus Diapherotrites archaeon CG11_big_fil_rev_8_21_14_0_20_37_9]|nr:MAG: hypothetical protein COV47_05810 [Candidatus Diapherotrites archaeon CG11_big_fil_rev_8_21_14_0_20_37_9]